MVTKDDRRKTIVFFLCKFSRREVKIENEK